MLHEPVDQAEQPVPPLPAGVDGPEAREVMEAPGHLAGLGWIAMPWYDVLL